MPSLIELENTVAQSDTLKLEDTHPFIAYAVAQFHYHNTMNSPDQVSPIIERILNSNQTNFPESFELVDNYWKSK
jgi:hypothetical protein